MYSPTDLKSVGECESVWKSVDEGTKCAYRTIYICRKASLNKIRQNQSAGRKSGAFYIQNLETVEPYP